MRLLIIMLLTLLFVSCAEEKRTYFGANWDETTKESASYYRITPVKQKGIWVINDYYISGEKQFSGQAIDSLAKQLDGDVTWYFKTGKVENKVRYINGEIVGEYVVKSGAIGSEEKGWEESDLLYYDHSNLESAADAKGNSYEVYNYFYTDTYYVASEHHTNVGKDTKASFTLYFNKNGDTIGRLDKNSASEKWNGTEVLFYENEQRGKNTMNAIKEIKTYLNGDHTYSVYYNEDGIELARGSFKENMRFSGSFYKETCGLYKVQYCEKGIRIKETTFKKSNENLGEIRFKDQLPYAGTYFNCTSKQTYKNGKLDGLFVQYHDDGAEEIEMKYHYKNGLRHGDYFIYEPGGDLLEKGTYKKDMQRGDVWYYHNGVFIEDGDMERYYYLKANVQTVNNKPFISEISEYDTETNELQQTFKFEANTTDGFTYVNNGYHAYYLKDLNNDGFGDLQVTYIHHLHDIKTQTYYFYNPESEQYQHKPELDDAEEILVNTSEKSIEVTLSSKYESDQYTLVTYGYSKNNLTKKLTTEHIYHRQKDTTIVTQTYPIPVNDFPLLDSSLPPITFVQDKNEQPINSAEHTINLNKEPFSIRLSGLRYKEKSKEFMTKVMASYDKSVFKVAGINQKVEQTPFYDIYATIAYDRDKRELYLSHEGYNILFYDDSNDDTLNYVKNLNDDVLLLDFTANYIFDEGESVPISEVNKPIYMVIFIDKNENYKVEENEIHYIVINLD